MYLTFHDQVRHQWRIQEHFNGRPPSFTTGCRQQTLRDKSLRVQRQIQQQLLVPCFRKKVDNTIQSLVRIVGMQGSKTQVPSLGKRNGMLHRFLIPNLTNQDDIWRLTQGIFQSDLKGIRIGSYLTLSNNTALMVMNKFNRILNGNDMAI